MKLWYEHPAESFVTCLPIGTGRLAAMVYGGAIDERLSLNHEWLWRGTNRNREADQSADKLAHVRELLLAGKYEEGTIAANDAFGGWGGTKAGERNNSVDPYQPAGDLLLRIHVAPHPTFRRDDDA